MRPFVVIQATNAPAPLDHCAAIELADTNKGFLPNRLTTAQRDDIPDPTPGLLIYNTDDDGYQFYDGSAWTAISVGSALTHDTTYYVSSDGSDSNNGSESAPWLTLQHAVDWIAANIDFAGFNVDIQLADSVSEYSGAIISGLYSSAPGISGVAFNNIAAVPTLYISGNPSDISAVKMGLSTTNPTYAGNSIFIVGRMSVIPCLRNFTIDETNYTTDLHLSERETL